MPCFRSAQTHSRRRRQPLRPASCILDMLEPRLLFTTTPAYNFASLVTFNRPVTGGQPEALVMDPNTGDLYGITATGGAKRDGTIFKIAAGSTTLQLLATFTGPNGAEPIGNLVLDSQGNLFGTTLHGGASDLGTVFELAANDTTHTITTLVSFNGSNGTYPLAGLIADSNGHLYGSTFGKAGTPSDKATVFEVAPSGSNSTLTVLATFIGARNYPNSTLVVDAQGNVFGTTRSGGTANRGTVFEVVTGSGIVTTLASFTGKEGTHPLGTLLTDGQGNLFGITSNGGVLGAGTIFEYSAGTITTLASFAGTDGAHPVGNLIRDASGNFFGVTATGGVHLTGTVFELPAGTGSKLITLSSLHIYKTGSNPAGPLVMNAQGDFFGATFLGGTLSGVTNTSTINGGTIFELLPSTEVPSAARLDLETTRLNNIVANHTLPNIFTVKIEDVFGNVLTNDNADVTLTISSGPAGATLFGQVTVSAQNGIATFTGISIQTAGTYTLAATEGPRVSFSTKAFSVLPDAASAHLVPPTIPIDQATTNSAGSGVVLLAPATVLVEDQFGNIVTGYHGKISWSVVPPTTPAGGVLTGIVSTLAVGGKATFNRLTLSLPDNATTANYTLQIAGANLTPIQINQDITD